MEATALGLDGHPTRSLAMWPVPPRATSVGELESSPLSRPTERWLGFHQSHAQGRVRERDHLWSGRFEGLARRSCRAGRGRAAVSQRRGRHRRARRLLPSRGCRARRDGGERRLRAARLPMLWQAGQPCGLVNARNVRRFAEAMGALEKTDRIDAAMIARFGQARRAARRRRRARPSSTCGPSSPASPR